jgi:hypothetical protein
MEATMSYSLAPASPEFVRAYRIACDYLAKHGINNINDAGPNQPAEQAIGPLVNGPNFDDALYELRDKLSGAERSELEQGELRSFDCGFHFGLLIGTLAGLPAIQRLPIWNVDDGIDATEACMKATEYEMKPDKEAIGGAR